MKRNDAMRSGNNVVTSGTSHSPDQMPKGSRIMNRRERRALKRANLSKPETVIKVLSPNEVYEPTVLYSSETTTNIDPAKFIAEIKIKIRQIWTVLGDIKASYSYQNQMGGFYSYQFTFKSDLITAETQSQRMVLLKAADDDVFQKLTSKPRPSIKTDAASVCQGIISCGKIMAEIMRTMWIVIVARPRPANNLEKYQIESGSFDCLRKNGVKEIGFSRSGTQIVVAAYLEKGLKEEDVEKLREKIQGRFTGAQFFIDTGIDRGERAAELANKVASELKSYPTSTLDKRFAETMAKIWFNPFIVKKEEEKQALQQFCA